MNNKNYVYIETILMESTSIILLLSLITNAVGAFVSFEFVKLLHKSSPTQYPRLLTLFSLAIGGTLFATHALNAHALHAEHIEQLTLVSGLSIFFTTLIGFTTLDAASKNNLPFKQLMLGGVQTAISGLGLNYFFATTVYTHTYQIMVIPLTLAMLLTFAVGLLTIMTLFWVKTYNGEHPYKIRTALAFVIAVGIFSANMIFNAAFYFEGTSAFNNPNLVSLMVAISLIFLFAMAFIIILFYDKLNPNTEKKVSLKGVFNSNTHLAFDPLTKLPNRDSLDHHLSATAKRCERNNESLALAYIDLDHFKPVNDNFGHHIGDLLLMEVCERLNKALRNCDYLARTGGDEFVIVLDKIDSHESIVAIVQRIVSSIKEPFQIEDNLIEISCSVGVAVYPRDGNLEKLKVSADAAMYKAKENGRNQYRFYDAEIEQASDDMQKTHRELLEAVKTDGFELHFQPKVITKTQAPAGAEALLRWNHPEKGILTPGHFLEAAERFGLIENINTWVIIEACKIINRAHKKGINLNLSVNLSRQQFRNPELVENIRGIMAEHDVPPQSLVFEISETHAFHNQTQFQKILSKFKIARLKVSVDDFGSHPFSLTYLQNLEISEVKLDKAFTANVAKSRSALAIVDAVVKLAHALNLNVVAEGVENEMQRKALATTDCDQLQGYYYSEPVPEADLFKMYRRLNDGFSRTGEFSIADYMPEPSNLQEDEPETVLQAS